MDGLSSVAYDNSPTQVHITAPKLSNNPAQSNSIENRYIKLSFYIVNHFLITMEIKYNTMIVASFYKYVEIDNPLQFQQEQLNLCKRLKLNGRIMIGEEGINGSIYGLKENVEEYRKSLKFNPLFSDLEFKEELTVKTAFRKLFVRLRKEIVNFGLDVNIKNAGEYINPKQLKELLDKKENIALLDVRNDYEVKVGRFQNATTIDIKNFRQFPNIINEIKNIKDKTIVTYCTGGIRCEKASAFLKENGFKNIYQLKGGILNYVKEFPDTYFEGKCFVFDDRLTTEANQKNTEPLNGCVWCDKKCDDYSNCHNIDCDKLFICCEECRLKNNKSCSVECSFAARRRKEH